MSKENEIQSSIPKALNCMKKDLKIIQSQSTKTGYSMLEMMVLVIIILQPEGKFFAD